ncbi:MAG: pyridoxamine 5'-phosphate oxidase family protein [Halobacteriota archaeon]|jgi:nitroimidazol reductase NimA-like FMN-containing flavoprotein (pyridoxamine 5'-phosphate oxidase superfamily)
MDILKIPRMEKEEYDRLIKENYVSRIAFKGDSYPYVAPFLYVFDGHNLFFLSTKYGKKIHYFNENPDVAVEIERISPDLSSYTFVTLLGTLVEVTDRAEGRRVRQQFVDMIKTRGLSSNVVTALGHSPAEPLESIVNENRSLVWKLDKVEEIVALKNA